MSKRRMEEKGIPFEEIDMSQNEDAFQKAQDLGYKSAPVLIAPDGSHWQGFVPANIDALAV